MACKDKSSASNELRPTGLTHQRSRSSTSNRPSRKNIEGFVATLRQKLTPSKTVSRTRYDYNRNEDSGNFRHKYVLEESLAALCGSWRAARPRRVENPIRPAYSDECLRCCTDSRCRRGSRSVYREDSGRIKPSPKAKETRDSRESAVVKTSSIDAKYIICHGRNDPSPSEVETPTELGSTPSPSGEEIIRKEILPIEYAYCALAYGHASASMVTTPGKGASSSSPVSEISPSSSCDRQATLHSHRLSQHSVQTPHLKLTSCDSPTIVVQTTVLPPMQPFYDEVIEHSTVAGAAAGKGWSLSKELFRLSNYGWYWGPITRIEAEEKLGGQTNGAFLVRDSSDDRFLLSLSFRSFGRTLHTSIEHCNGVFSFYALSESEKYGSIVDLIEHSMIDSQVGVFCYSPARVLSSPSFPVRLAKPLLRFAQIRTLQYLCRFVIRQYTRVDHIQQLPLPISIKGWLEESQY